MYWHATRADGVVVTYREFVHTGFRRACWPRLSRSAAWIVWGAGERIRDIYLSPDAFAQRTADASIADQLGDGLAAAGLPRDLRQTTIAWAAGC